MKMKIPGVTVSEAAGMGSSVEMVDTAVPVFIGYSEKAVEPDGTSLTGVPKRIASLGDYEEYFGGAYRETLYVDVTQAAGATLAAQFVTPPAGTTPAPTLTAPFFLPSFLLHGSIALFYANGGRACYVLSVGPYGYRNGAPDISSAALKDALPVLEAHVGPTLVVIPDACRLSLTAQSTDIRTVADIANAALAHCRKMQDRFAIIDVPVSQAALAPDAAAGVLEADIAFRSHLIDDCRGAEIRRGLLSLCADRPALCHQPRQCSHHLDALPGHARRRPDVASRCPRCGQPTGRRDAGAAAAGRSDRRLLCPGG